MASVDKVKVGKSTYNISPSSNGTLKGFTSNDAASPTAWSAADAITTSDTNSTIFSKITTMIKNVRWLYSKLGTTDFSATGQSTVTGALSALQSGLNGKAASSHSHNASQLPISSSQTNSNSYIPTSALVYSMQQQINSLNDAIEGFIGKVVYITVTTPNYISLFDINKQYFDIASQSLDFDSSKFGFCTVQGSIKVDFRATNNAIFKNQFFTVSMNELSYNSERDITIKSSVSFDYNGYSYNRAYQFYAKYTDKIFKLICYMESSTPCPDTGVKITSCNITAKFHN